jgi:alpha-D-ribose 1-methylphosphonate 5-phosphate C-P lyase
MNATAQIFDQGEYNFAYLDEQTKRMIRRAILKGIAIPGYQVPFASREMPMPYGWGTGGVQVTASILGKDDCLKMIDQGSDDTTNAVSLRGFFEKTANVRTTYETSEATVIQTRHRIPEKELREDQVLGVPGSDPRTAPVSGAAGNGNPQDACPRRLRSHARETLRGHRQERPHRHHIRLSGNGQ